MSLGSALRSAREAAGISVDQLAARTRIRGSLIRDLERDRFDSAGGATYARGHIRAISQVLGVDAGELLREFDSQIETDERTINAKLADNNATPDKSFRRPVSWKALAGIAAGIIAVALTVQGVISTTNIFSKTGSPTAQQKNNEPTVVATKTSGVTLQFEGVNGLSWVSITDSTDAPVFSGMIKAGDVRTFSDNQLLHAVIGNGGAVKLSLNGQDLGVPGAQGEVLHLQFTPDGSSQG